MSICKVNTCGKKVYGHGYCRNHYLSWKKHGNPFVKKVNQYKDADACRNGHVYTPETTGVEIDSRTKRQRRRCLTCVEISKRTHWLRVRYNLSINEFNAILRAQRSKCILCSKPLDLRKRGSVHVDHDHACCPTNSCGKCIRGIVCQGCNIKMGVIDALIKNRTLDKYISYATRVR